MAASRPSARERGIIDNAFRLLYENGHKMLVSTLPEGTVILDRATDEHCEDGENIYQVFVLYRVGAKKIYGAHFNSDLIAETGFEIDPKAMVVVLGDRNNLSFKREQVGAKHTPQEGLRLSVQTRTRSLVLFRYGVSSNVLFLTEVRHDKDGVPLGGYVVNGGYRMTLRNGAMKDGGDTATQLPTDYFEVLYVDEALRRKAAKRRLGYLEYEEVFEHMNAVPKKFRLSFGTKPKDLK